MRITGVKFWLLAIAALVGLCASQSIVTAQLIAADSYDVPPYSTGALGGQNPNVTPGWTSSTAWTAGSANLQASTATLENAVTTYDNASTGKGSFVPVGSDTNFRRAFRQLDAYTPADTYYMSFLVNPGGSFTSPGNRQHALVGFTNSFSEDAFENTSPDNVYGLQVGFRGQDAGAAADTVDLILRARDSTGDLVDTVLLADAGNEPTGDTYHVLLKLEVNVGGGTADDVTYWVNPGDITSEAAATTSTATTATISTAAMDANTRIDRVNVLANQWAFRSFFWDETRFGYDFASVVGAAAVADDADFNGDSIVDGTDFLTWQQGFGTGTSLAQGDANGSGTVDAADLAVWNAQYGTTSGLASLANVPEPSAMLLLALAGLGGIVFRHR